MAYRRVIKEKILRLIQESDLSPEQLVHKLFRDPDWRAVDVPDPKTIRNWRKKQPDIEMEQPAAESSELRIEQQADSLILEAQKEHLSGIEFTIEQWTKIVYTLDIHHIEEFHAQPIYSVEENPIFDCLKEHLPFKALWQDYGSWRKQYFDYLGKCEHVIRHMNEESWKWRNENKDLKILSILDGFERHMLDCIQYINPLRRWLESPPGRESYDWRDNIYCKRGPYKPREFFWQCLGDIGNQSLRADGYRVLTAEDAMAVSDAYQTFVDRLLTEEDVTSIRILFYDLRELEQKIQKSLQDILIKHDYLNFYCRLCPKEQKIKNR
jgi:hypothetical protein